MQLQHTHTIDDIDVLTTLFKYDEAAELSFELVQKISPVVQLLTLEMLNDMKKLEAAAGPMLIAISREMKPGEWAALLKRLIAGTTLTGPFGPKGEREKADLHTESGRNKAFTGRVSLAFQVALFAIKVNFQDFFGALGGSGITPTGDNS